MHSPEGTVVSHMSPLAGAHHAALDEAGFRNVGQAELSALCWVPGGAAALCSGPSLPWTSPASFLTFLSSVPSRYPSPPHRPSCLIIPHFIRTSPKFYSKNSVWSADSGENFQAAGGKALPEGIICCKKIRKPVTSDLHTWDGIVLVLWHWQVRREGVRMKARLC